MRSHLPALCALIVVISLARPGFGQESFDVEEAVALALQDLASIEPQVRVRGARSLRRLGTGASCAAPHLIAALDGEEEVVSAALDALSYLAPEDPRFLDRLEPAMPKLIALLDASEYAQAYDAKQILSKMGARVRPLARELRRVHEQPRSRAICLEISGLLAEMGEDGLAELIRGANTKNELARESALYRLREWTCETEEAASMLAGVVRWSKDPLARKAALLGLAKSGPKAKIAIHDIARAADDPQTVSAAMQAILATTSDPKDCVPVLLAGYYKNADVEVRCKAILELRRFPRHPGVQAAFIDAIWDGQCLYPQIVGIQGLRDCPGVDTWAPHLLAILDEEREGAEWDAFQVAAAATLTIIGYRTDVAVPFLLRAIEEFDEETASEPFAVEDWEFRAELEAARALGRLNPRAKEAPRAIAFLRRAFAREGKTRTTAFRIEAAKAIFELLPETQVRTARSR